MKKTAQIWVLFVLVTGIMLIGCGPASVETITPAASEPEVNQDQTVESAEDQEPVEEPVTQETEEQPASEFTASITAQGEVILISGRVLAADGTPLPGAAVEFWQTDNSGVYDHPGDPGTANRDMGFQFYGTSVADADGIYSFRTIKPGEYEPRPTHIHVKVKLDGRELLTTQFYFAEDNPTGFIGEGGGLLQLVLAADPASGVRAATFDIVVNAGESGTLNLTPSQGEGPFYPVVPVADYDNDLASVEN